MRWILPLLLLTGCSGRAVVTARPEAASVAVTVPCTTPRPAKVSALREQIPAAAWQQRTMRQKAAEIAAQALRRQTYGEGLEAATAACQ